MCDDHSTNLSQKPVFHIYSRDSSFPRLITHLGRAPSILDVSIRRLPQEFQATSGRPPVALVLHGQHPRFRRARQDAHARRSSVEKLADLRWLVGSPELA